MLRMIQSKSAAQAQSYYVQGLSKEDYYAEGQELTGTWQGKAAELLGLPGEVGANEFYDLCENRDPSRQERLTARTNAARRVGYDFNFHAPKSVSAMYAHTNDDRIVGALREAVGETMREMEADMQTRVRIGGAQGDRVTGNMVWAEFVHKTARPVDGKPDPHLHVHCFTFNATHDSVEGRWKAGEFGDIKRDAPYYEAAFHSRFAGRMCELGYDVAGKGKFWEIDGVPQSVIDKYSQRRDQIEALAEKLGITDAAEKDKLGATSREKKVKMSMDELTAEWSSRLTPGEKAAMDSVYRSARGNEGRVRPKEFGEQAIDHALSHVFERASVVSERDVLESALRFGIGRVSVEEAEAAFDIDKRVIRKVIEGEARCTTYAVRDEEREIVAFAKERRGSLEPMKAGPHQFADRRLNPGQQGAIKHVLGSRDQVTIVRGRPGTGKTTLMQEAVQAINDAGYSVVTLAPTAESSRVALRKAGFSAANTVESFLQSPEQQKQARGQVLWIDEAGLLSARALHRVFDVAKAQGCRVILVGDTGQHNAVERGDAMRTLEKHAGLPVPEVTKIIRQDGIYREAVKAMSGGDIEKAFSTLEKMKAFVVDTDIARLHEKIVDDYVGL